MGGMSMSDKPEVDWIVDAHDIVHGSNIFLPDVLEEEARPKTAVEGNRRSQRQKEVAAKVVRFDMVDNAVDNAQSQALQSTPKKKGGVRGRGGAHGRGRKRT